MDPFEKLKDVLSWAKYNEHSSLYQEIPDVSVLRSLDDLKKFPYTTVDRFRSNSENLRHYREEDIRYTSSEFDPDRLDELFLVPQRADEMWYTLNAELKDQKPRAALLSIPPFWQVAPLFYHTCHAQGVPVSVANPRSPNLSVQVIEGVAMEYAIATAPVIHELRAGLVEKRKHDSIRFWHIVTPLGAIPNIPELLKDVRVAVEYHIFPGVPVAYTSPEMYRENSPWSIPLPMYHYEFDDQVCYITSLERHALPFVRLKLPVPAEVKGSGADVRMRFV